jgi:hypothetical protein
MPDYRLYVFDASRHRDLIPETVEDVNAVRNALDRLCDQEDGLNPRFMLLGEYLGQKDVLDRFPVFDPRKGEGQKFVWREDPKQVLREWKGAVWQPECNDARSMGRFVAVLLRLSRYLGLDVYDEMIDVYVPAKGMALPRERASHYRLGLDPGAAKIPGLALSLPDEPARPDFPAPSEQGPALRDWSPKRGQDGEWEQYPLYVFDVRRHSDLGISTHLENKNLAALEQAVHQLRQREDRTNPCFRRLGKVLARRLPEKEFWRNDPESELSSWTLATWQPTLGDPRRIGELLRVLLPLARRLELQVFDAFQRIYLPGPDHYFMEEITFAPIKPVPVERAEVFQEACDPECAQEQKPFTQAEYSALFEEPLSVALKAYGFAGKPGYTEERIEFVRGTNGTEQSIGAHMSVRHLSCRIYLEVKSNRVRNIFKRWGEDVPEYRVPFGFGENILYLPFDDIRVVAQPDWKNKNDYSIPSFSILTQEEANWMIEDLLQYGLPLLDRAWTVEDMDWLYNRNPLTARYVRDVGLYITIPRPFFRRARLATIYARLAGNPAFDEIVRDFGQRMEILPDFDDDGRLGNKITGMIRSRNSAHVYKNDDDGKRFFVDTEVDSEGNVTRTCYRKDSSGNKIPEKFLPSEFGKRYAKLVELCRTDLEPVNGDEPA